MQRVLKYPSTTKKQREILLYLLKFRFLTTHQIRILLNHKNSTRILKMLKNLIEKDCVRRKYERNSFINNTKPAIYYLGPKARHILLKEKEINLSDLEYIYKEHRREEKFINHCLFLAEIYLYLLNQKEVDEEIKFFTKFELGKYSYFPNPLPDAFIAVVSKDYTRRYFLDVFDEYSPPFVARKRVRAYVEYNEKSEWGEHTNDAQFPKILFVFEKESLMRHIKIYGKTQLDKTNDDKVLIYLTTKTLIQYENNKNIWEQV